MAHVTTVPFTGTPEQEQKLRGWLSEHKDMPGIAMPALQYAQEVYGYLPIEVQRILAQELDVPLEEIYGIATFYSQFSLKPKGQYKVSVCLGTACYVKGSGKIYEKLQEKVDVVPLPDLIQAVIDETDYLAANEDDDENRNQSRQQNLEELGRIAQEFMADENEENTLEAFLNHVALVADIDDAKMSSEAVTLMTIHSSKGLEYPVIFLAGMEEGLFPSARAGDSDDAIEEERRLCYVGITRAKRRLFLSSCRSRMMYGSIVMYQPSRFLGEIPRNLITKIKVQRNPGYGYGQQQSGLRSIAQTRHKEWRFGEPIKKESFAPQADTPLAKFSLGDKVKHKKWGIGTIVNVSQEEEGQQVKVAFPGLGVKTLLTRLRIIEKI